MSYYFTKTVNNVTFDNAVENTRQALKNEGFGVIAEIDFQKTLKEKLDVDFRRYLVLEACNPPYAFKSLNAEDKIGTLLPCNFVIQEKENGIEVSSVDPIAMMAQVKNPEMQTIAQEISEKLKGIVESL